MNYETKLLVVGFLMMAVILIVIVILHIKSKDE